MNAAARWTRWPAREIHGADPEAPLRSELFSADQMEHHGQAIAGAHRLASGSAPERLLPRLAANEAVLLEVCDGLAAAIAQARRITPAAEWLLDNFYLIDEQIRTAKRHLPRGYSRVLPRLATGASAGLPRVYDLALEAISHGDGRVDADSLERFVAAYQAVTPLALGELWAVPIMLRLALIENLRRIGARILAATVARGRADAWADEMMATAESDPRNLILVIADMARSDPPMVSGFVAELARRLQGHGAALALPLTWIEQRLSESGSSIEQLVRAETQRQAATQVSISNTIGSLRFLGAMDWRTFVESMSGVERELARDPAGAYGRMDFATRDRYRHVVEEIARSSARPESDVARAAVALSQGVAGADTAARGAHVGYFLIDAGRSELEAAMGARVGAAEALRRAARRAPVALYLGLIGAATVAGSLLLLARVHRAGAAAWLVIVLAPAVVLVASQLALRLVNWLATIVIAPRTLPRMDFSRGLPGESRTVVVVPAMLTTSAEIEDLLEALEVRYLANRDTHLAFVLITDMRDAPACEMPEDEALVETARAGVGALNLKHPGGGFFLLHRPRRWNAQERAWMGRERKRGKLADLNALLRGRGAGRFSVVVGDAARLEGARYVITLDADTQLPRDSARQFVAVMAHPLNHPRFDAAASARVVEGYGILQPRVAASLRGSSRSWYANLHGGETGIDPYTRAISDVYQDLAGEGSFIGKGIYDVDAFERALEGRLPDNRILSHDLLEGCHARSGLISDVQLHEDDPATYAADMARRHRWVRGDWQLAGWLWPRVPGPGATAVANPLSRLSQWKLLDNLRRSLVPPALVGLLVAAWAVLPEPALWTLAVLAVLALPSAGSLARGAMRKPPEMLVRQHLAASAREAGRTAALGLLRVALLPHEAASNLDAIARTLWRLHVSNRRLLEWNPSAAHAGALGAASIAVGPLLAVAATLLLASVAPAALAIAFPFLALWLASPALVAWADRPFTRREPRLTRAQALFLRDLARRTWAFFETWVGPADHHLPPDNFQEHPVATVAHRTSPTNMGLALLANVAANDFGYIPPGELATRTAAAFDTMERLERHEGHFYNWYDTTTLAPLPPRYVSAVDSGNLAGHLLTLRPALLEAALRPVIGRAWVEGLEDTARTLGEVSDRAAAPALAALALELGEAGDASLGAARERLERVGAAVARVAAASTPAPGSDAAFWSAALVRQARAWREELALLAPLDRLADALPIPTLRELAAREGDGGPAGGRIAALEALAARCVALARMEYAFLYDDERDLLAIGYNVTEGRRDPAFYDLLASEARFASFVAIAQGQLPQENWFALGRRLTASGGFPVLLSWSGSMFEYLMPLLVMPTYDRTLLDQTCRVVVERQVAYGRQRGVPWGISESGYNAVDAALNYQYHAFGVPGLGSRRGLGDDLVVAPYASALALVVAPEEACANLQELAGEGLAARYGLYEAVDYTPSRIPRGQASVVVRSFMAHHQGMILLALAHTLLGRPMQRRFESEPLFQATLLLLQERLPKTAAPYAHPEEVAIERDPAGERGATMRVIASPDAGAPEVQLLSNGRYHVMVTQGGGGSSRWKDLAVTRGREEATGEALGTFCYLRDVAEPEFWSSTYQPVVRSRAQSHEAIFTEARAEFRRLDHELEAHTEIAVSPEDDVELRRLRLTNRSRARRTFELTTYAEVVLAPAAADALHPAFSKLFVQTEFVAERSTLLCTRRPRSHDEPAPWMFHLAAVHGAESIEVSCETDRMAFIGRGNTLAAPAAMASPGRLAGGLGSVLDPVVAIRHRITLEPRQTAVIDVATGIATSRDGALDLAGKYRDRHLADRVFDLAWTHSWVSLRQIDASEADAQLYARLAGSVLFPNAALRAAPSLLLQNRRGQSGLWSYAISGDLPIVLLQVGDAENIELARQVVRAHAYWRLKGLAVDLVIWNEDRGGYRQVLQDRIMGLVAGVDAHLIDRPGGIFVRRMEQISDEDRVLLQSVARVVLTDRHGSLEEQLLRRRVPEPRVPQLVPTRARRAATAIADAAQERLARFNGRGGFTPDGTEYVITLPPGESTPAPWSNVLANAHFGSVVSESGSAYTWSENAHSYRLSPWHNDAVGDASGEAFFLRDEETGHYWSPTALPARGGGTYVTRHGFGYSAFETREDDIASRLTVFVALDAPVKLAILEVSNPSARPRRLGATGYVEWVLGDLRSRSAMHVVTGIDPASGAVVARNPFGQEFAQRVAFFAVDDPSRTVTGDRAEFLGRGGMLGHPSALSRAHLSGRTGAALDPCAALHVAFELAPGASRTLVFVLGAAHSAAEAASLSRRFNGPAAATAALEAVKAHWARLLGAVQVRTPDAALDVLVNGWLVYQTVACRMWARSGYYQSGGAFGFRDQLQDAMALIHAEPALLREQLLRCAARQFIEGDVQHWWHPPSGRGVRTRCSDDFLWLPLAAARYVRATGDASVLDVPCAYIEGRAVNPGDDSYYDLPAPSSQSGPLYEHCTRAIANGLRFGAHGLPLMGSGDWNDGMNRVGIEGRGESVWLGFFLCAVLRAFAPLARGRGDAAFAARCEAEEATLRANLERHGWDGGWYRRAYFDDGTPLGSAANAECRIDSISQSWAVLSGARDPARSRAAMEAVDAHLVRRDHGLVQLLDPPFDATSLDPGYIRGYVPGVRENGGQYTHGAIWAAMAFAALGDGERAWEIASMLNPVNRAATPAGVATYKVEPYVVAADVYAVPPHAGRGGWSWYTGSAGWMYRLFLESLLGVRREGARLRFAPRLPAAWTAFDIRYRHGATWHHIRVERATSLADAPAVAVTLDGVPQPGPSAPLVDDGVTHVIVVACAGGPQPDLEESPP